MWLKTPLEKLHYGHFCLHGTNLIDTPQHSFIPPPFKSVRKEQLLTLILISSWTPVASGCHLNIILILINPNYFTISDLFLTYLDKSCLKHL